MKGDEKEIDVVAVSRATDAMRLFSAPHRAHLSTAQVINIMILMFIMFYVFVCCLYQHSYPTQSQA